MEDVKVLVALYTTKSHQKLLEANFLQPKYYWSAGVITGLVNYATFLMKRNLDKTIQGEDGFGTDYKVFLWALVEDLKGEARSLPDLPKWTF